MASKKSKLPEPLDHTLFPDPAHCIINGIEFIPDARCKYLNDYKLIHKQVALCRPAGVEPELWERTQYRRLVRTDLWFILFFVMRIPPANHPYVVDFCREVGELRDTNNLYLCARGHFKSTVVTIARNIQRIIKDPETTIGIFSHTRPAAMTFLRGIKFVLEQSDFLKWLFPEVLYEDPKTQAPKWSESDGLIVKRTSMTKEATVESYGLIEGMPTGKHFKHRTYDDIVTADLVNTPEVMEKLVEAFDMSQNLASLEGSHEVVGTPYHHEDLLAQLRTKKLVSGEPVYHVVLRPATEDGTPNGAPVLLTQTQLDELRLNRQAFFSQQLLDPTPLGEQKLDYALLKHVDPEQIPKGLFRFMLIDPAGGKKNGKGDAWAIGLIGVRPYLDDAGLSDVYLLDLVAEPLGEAEALETITKMYIGGGLIRQLGVEKVAMSSVEVHVANALRAKGRAVSIESGTLVLLRPGGRRKEERIVQNLQYPLLHGKLHMSKAIPEGFRQRLKLEMDKFPYWHDDILDMLSYGYDLIKGYRFGRLVDTEAVVAESPKFSRSRKTTGSWLIV